PARRLAPRLLARRSRRQREASLRRRVREGAEELRAVRRRRALEPREEPDGAPARLDVSLAQVGSLAAVVAALEELPSERGTPLGVEPRRADRPGEEER